MQPVLRFRIENFQSIADQTIDLGGFTAIVGPSNLGKSALIRAFRAWAYNELHLSDIREGTKECRLTGEFLTENPYQVKTIVFRKSAKVNLYTVTFVDGTVREYPKIGTDTPDELKKLNFNLLTTERDEIFNLNFQSQLEGLFLVTNTPTTLTSFLNQIFDIARYERALRRANSDTILQQRAYDDLSLKHLQATNRLDDEQTALTTAVTRHDELTTHVTALKAAEARLEQLERAEAAIRAVETLKETYTRRECELALLRLQHEDFIQVQHRLATLRTLTRTRTVLTKHTALRDANAQEQTTLQPRRTAIAQLLDQLQSYARIALLATTLTTAQDRATRTAGALRSATARLTSVGHLADRLARAHALLSARTTRLTLDRQQQSTLAELGAATDRGALLTRLPAAISRAKQLTQHRLHLQRHTDARSQLTTQVAQQTRAADDFARAHQFLLAHIPVCPTCHRAHAPSHGHS